MGEALRMLFRLADVFIGYKLIVSIANNFANSRYCSIPINTAHLLATISIMVTGTATVVPPTPAG